jgi:hypothetical protein
MMLVKEIVDAAFEQDQPGVVGLHDA